MKCYWLCLCVVLYRVTTAASDQTTKEVKCASFGSPSTKVLIPPDRINDGYCDCPFDGLDEPDTEACSGSVVGGWTGVPATLNDGVKFICPQEPNLSLPVSRINDGICDCCDGADEVTSASSKCVDVCEQVLRAQRQARQRLEQDFQKGHARRIQELEAFDILIQQTQEEVDALTRERESIQSQLTTVQEEIEQWQHDSLKRRLLAVRDTILSLSHSFESDNKDSEEDSAPLKGLLEPLSEDGLVTVIVQACQLAGEQQQQEEETATSSGYSSTCVPLRMAGLDVGIVWGDENLKDATVTERERLTLASRQWQQIMDRNAAAAVTGTGQVVWSLDDNETSNKRQHDRRRLSEYHTDDDMVGYDEEEDWDEHEEDYYSDGDDYTYPDRYRHDEEEEEDEKNSFKEEDLNPELLDGVKAFAFSAARLSFLNRATHLIERIDALLKDSDDAGDNEEQQQEGGDDRLNAPKVDPVALQAVRTTLTQRKNAIERGFKYAVSAQILVKPFEGSHQDLVALAAGTLYHGMIRSSDLWQILAYMTVEFPTHACFSPWSILCPPQISDHKGNPFPPLPIVEAVKHYCEDGPHSDASVICDVDADEEIPPGIHDHYYGYTVIEPRDENDVLSKAFARLDNLGDRSEIAKLEEKRDELKKKLGTLSSRLRQLEDQMGGRDHSKYGNHGELYSLRDSCHSVQEGKYDYEVCIFGRASQNDHGSKSGTPLGKWSGISIDKETGLRKMEWTHGAKCWNGPERSATVFVTCGAENKVFSAEEPDTCRYVLEMESYIACDDEYKQRHGL